MGAEFFFSWYDAFEVAAAQGDFAAVRALLADDAVYEVEGVPYACRIEGADAIVEGLRRSLTGFDHRFDTRLLGVMGAPQVQDERITAQLLAVWQRGAEPALVVVVPEDLYLRDGRIVRIHDRYQPEALGPALAWLGEYGADLDASYTA